MNRLLNGYPDDLSMKLSLYVAQIYGYSQGNSAAEFKRLCFTALQPFIPFDSGCWFSYKNSQLKDLKGNCWIYDQSKRQLEDYPFLLNKPLAVLRPNNVEAIKLAQTTRYPATVQEQKKYHSSTAYQTHGKALDLIHNLTTISKTNINGGSNESCQLISLFRRNKQAFYSQQELEIKTWVTPYLIAASLLNQLSSEQREWQISPSYRAVCDKLGNIEAAEDGFYQLLSAHLNNGNKHTLAIDLTRSQVKLDNLKIEICNDEQSYRLEVSKQDVFIDNLTKTERNVALLLAQGLRTKPIAEQLNSSPRTVEKHLASIYKKLSTTNKNDTIAYLIKHL
jgi:DNA-binding CsgD family transcriptional regulator